jgi:hypothetical protein
MLTQIKKHLENPQDIPNVPRAVSEYLQVQFNAGYAMQSGLINRLKAAGWSESYLAGYLAGLQYASQTLDDMETIRKELAEP